MAIKNIPIGKRAKKGLWEDGIPSQPGKIIVFKFRNLGNDTPLGKRRELERDVREILLRKGYTEEMADGFFTELKGRYYLPALIDIKKTNEDNRHQCNAKNRTTNELFCSTGKNS